MTETCSDLEGTGQDVALRRVLLLGNPNVGKSALFNALTGLRAVVSNYPGTTVEVCRGRMTTPSGDVELVDSPGVNSVLPSSEDERVTFELVQQARSDGHSVVLQVADAKNLRRALLLTLELGQLKVRSLLVLNMADEAESRGLRIDVEGLSNELGIPVHATVATDGRGVADLSGLLAHAAPPRNHMPLPSEAEPALEFLEGKAELPCAEEAPLSLAPFHEALLARAGQLAARFVRSAGTARVTRGARIGRYAGRLAVHPVWGWPVLLGVLYAVYLVVGVFGAGVLVELFEKGLFGRIISPLAKAAFGVLPWPFVRDMFVGEYGLVTMGLSYGVAIVLPIVFTFFSVFALLEDSGYLPRLAVMSDRAFRVVGLNGKAVLPMVLGLGCDTMATLTTRILETRKERIIATLLLALGVPCSAQLGVILAMLAAVPLSAGLVWGGSVLAVMLVVGLLAAWVLPGRTAEFVVELPPMRRPRLGNVAIKTLARLEWYLKEALPLFLVGTLVLFLLDWTGLLVRLVAFGEPLVKGLLGLPKEASAAFLIGFLRRDFGATHLFEMSRSGALSTVQTVVAMVTITLFIPCIANVFMIAKERGLRVAAAMTAFVFPLAFAAGALVRLFMEGVGAWR